MGREEKKLNFSISVPRGRQRFRELIIYVSSKCKDDPYFGAIKLNKILYYSDFLAYYRFGVPLTGYSYFRLKNGPAPRAMVPIRRELQEEGAIKVEERDVGSHKQHRVIPLREAVVEHFTRDELHLVDEVIAELLPLNATEVSNASHDVRWRVLNDKDDLPYEFAFLSEEPLTPNDIERTKQLAAQFGW